MTKTISLVLFFSALVAIAYSESPLPFGPSQGATPLGQQPPAANEGAENPCLLKPRNGMCLAYIPSWFYNASSGSCQDFIWGGCDGNANRFWTEEDCMKRCGGTVAGSDSSENDSSNPASEEVDTSNSEPTNQESSEISTPASEEAGTQETGKSEESGESSPDMCKQPAVPGKCRAFLPRFYFNDENGKCESFIYGGCDGNLNNFKSEEECEKSCHFPRQEK
ncbi:kunitz-type U19-barytoxin-Tl1a-like [Uloborus diversus]|uniref:kunitz-type U19-barytoxin-Tl1a-like n=1 Tax=Uloborus diversus TaxID=327109 RepID=UPI0024092C08|nr:kunitz-type U19-barytoxin-Tl1a-like [Uloborus diversus]